MLARFVSTVKVSTTKKLLANPDPKIYLPAINKVYLSPLPKQEVKEPKFVVFE